MEIINSQRKDEELSLKKKQKKKEKDGSQNE